MRSLKTIAAATAVSCVLAGAARSAEPLNIHVGWVTMAASSVPLSLEKKDILKHYGQSYVIDPISMKSTAAMITALATGDVNIGTLAYSSLAFAIENAKINDIRIITGVNEDGVGNYATTNFMVLKDGPIKKVEDLKGKVVASLTTGSAVDIGLRAMLRKHKLDDKKDVTFVEAQFPNMRSLLMEHKVDLVSMILPFKDDPQIKENATTLFTQKDAMGKAQLLVWAGRKPFLDANRAAVMDFIEDSVRFTRYITDPANHAEAVAMTAKAMKQPPEALDYLYTERDLYKDPKQLPDLDALQANIDLEHELGFIPHSIKVKDYTDLSFVQEADKRLTK
jgi:NitT/TauT family transport system substrate-binding protein